MPHAIALLALVAVAQGPDSDGHDRNPIYKELVEAGLTVAGTTLKLPAPTLPDGRDAASGLAALKALAGDDRAARELLRDSVTAPFLLRTRDLKAGDSTIRAADLYFVVHADLDAIDPERAARQADAQAVEAGNMRFEARLLQDRDLPDRPGLRQPAPEGARQWYSHVNGRLLDRIAFEATERAVATRTPGSLVVAARTDHAFDRDGRYPNRWQTLARKGPDESRGPDQPYEGGASYVKMTRLAAEPGALFVEAHFAFVEPDGWFQGNPILRSKFALIAQDQVRRLRREIQQRRGR